MWQTVVAGGWVMLPLVMCSALALAIGMERLWALRGARVAPPRLIAQLPALADTPSLSMQRIQALREHSPLGRVLAAVLVHRGAGRVAIREHVEEAGRHVIHELERYLNTLGTIAAITPLLGLLGTVIGMIKVFAAITGSGVGDPRALAGGISEALLTTAAGLLVAIPSLILYRYLRGRVDALVMTMEAQALRLLELQAQAPEAAP